MSPSSRETMQYDVVIVGAGPAGLSAAIRLKQLRQELRVCILEKGSEVGAHLLSGAVLEPTALTELIPDWREKGAPLKTAVRHEAFLLLTKKRAFPLPVPIHNKGNYIISLGVFARWLAQQAEALGVEIYPSFAAAEILYDDNGQVIGVATGDMGLGKDGQPTAHYTRGIEIHAAQTLFAEGCHGSLTKDLFQRFNLRQGVDPQTYGLGLKEVWEVDPAKHRPGHVLHTLGWPLDHNTYGGAWLYHLEDNLVSVGLVVGLDYQNPYLSPFEEMQRFKKHPKIMPLFEGGRRISYGAKALNEGGVQSLPKLTFPGGMLIGDTAGFLDVLKLKGIHMAMKSGMVAAESLSADTDYRTNLEKSWLWKDFYRARNIRPGFHKGLWPGLCYAALDKFLLRGRAPWTFKNHADHLQLRKAALCKPIAYPKPDGKITFDRLSSVALSNLRHAENQPVHLTLKDEKVPIAVNLKFYKEPAQRYCPAGVYEIVQEAGQPKLQINAANCVHCKTCDIKDPTQNIHWIVPEGGSGPNYTDM